MRAAGYPVRQTPMGVRRVQLVSATRVLPHELYVKCSSFNLKRITVDISMEISEKTRERGTWNQRDNLTR